MASINPISSQNNPQFNLKYFPQSDVLANTLDTMFPEQQHEDKTFKKAKEILVEAYTDDEVRSLISSFEYLITNWLEEFEKKNFDNKTLQELLRNL